jgi:hypothetical protein
LQVEDRVQFGGHVQHGEAEGVLLPARGQLGGEVAERRLVHITHPGAEPADRLLPAGAGQLPEPGRRDGRVEGAAGVAVGEQGADPAEELINGVFEPVHGAEHVGLVGDRALDGLNGGAQLGELGHKAGQGRVVGGDALGVPGALLEGGVRARGAGHEAVHG